MSRRYFLTYSPIEHINGKLAQAVDIVRNVDDPEKVVQEGYFYGYRHLNDRCKVSHFALRKKGRNLNSKPYTQAELANRTLFTTSLGVVRQHFAIAGDKAKCEADFTRQRKYVTLFGYAVAAVRANGGQWIPDWT